ncbi:Hsp20/alpha crystallin family protein [Agromyces sp. M3QZ16-3]|uniref:Hsp20/alpha crystallin family protein n=1 Tax=Agromyces sp. M3QZ16-3 TaxID=3447585 RepID=UPI003F68D9A7
MAMTWDPFRDLDRLAASMIDSSRGPRMMPIDLHRDGDHYVLSADLPGVDPGSIDIDIDGQLLTVRAERTLRNDEGVRWLVHERPSGSFLRQLTLGEGIDTSGISAHYDNGVLSVIIPVSERAKPRKVEVRSAASDVVTPEVTSGS